MIQTATCSLCGAACVPMADYDEPVCVRCDDRLSLMLDLDAAPPNLLRWAAGTERPFPIPPEPLEDGPEDGEPEPPAAPSGPRKLKPCGTYAAWRRHRRAGERPCPPCVEAFRAYHRVEVAYRRAAA